MVHNVKIFNHRTAQILTNVVITVQKQRIQVHYLLCTNAVKDVWNKTTALK